MTLSSSQEVLLKLDDPTRMCSSLILVSSLLGNVINILFFQGPDKFRDKSFCSRDV